MIWKNSKEMMSELLLSIGLMMIALGFIIWSEFSPFEIALSGLIVAGIGVWRIIKFKQFGGKKK